MENFYITVGQFFQRLILATKQEKCLKFKRCSFEFSFLNLCSGVLINAIIADSTTETL